MRLVTLIIAILLVSVGSSLADRSPTPEERAKIESTLRSQGFVRWGEIELDDGAWEVDDAHAADGRKYELKLDPSTLQIIKRERD
jgi:uncharacterized membrane protein YkoI